MCAKLENILANHCSPAMFGIKSANLICIRITDIPNAEEEIDMLNKNLNGRITARIIKKTNDVILVMIYQNCKLKRTIFNEDNHNYLVSLGYPTNGSIDDYLLHLSSRITCNMFPHEIGVFLNYDLNDIIDFSNKNKKSIYSGYWQVFSDLEKKKIIFNKYSKCRNLVINLINKGYKLETLI